MSLGLVCFRLTLLSDFVLLIRLRDFRGAFLCIGTLDRFVADFGTEVLDLPAADLEDLLDKAFLFAIFTEFDFVLNLFTTLACVSADYVYIE